MPTDTPNLPHAPGWALTTGVLGQGLILLGLLVFLAVVVNSCVFQKQAWSSKANNWLFALGALSLFGAIICLGTLFANNQFEFAYVFGHSDASTDIKYKIAGIWAGQQGSFLLWSCTAAIFSLLAMPKEGPYRRWYQIFFSVFLTTLCGILAYETPFEVNRLHGIAYLLPNGVGLTPSLENYWVVIHPPTIFMGFGSLTVAAAYGFAAMMSGNLKDWVPLLRPWAILSTSILGIGLCMGGFWAYETLGWGGFWAWDPVENVSFVPWIFNIALLHGLLVQQAKKTWYGANLVLAGLPFFIFCYGTFLTRSGFLSEASVHSFTQMNKFALWLLAAFVALGALAYFLLYAFEGRKLAKALNPVRTPEQEGLNREMAYASGNLLLAGLGASTAIGMSIPFFLALMNRNSKVVEPGLYHQVVVWFFVPIMVLMGIAPFISWRNMSFRTLWSRLTICAAITFGLTGLALYCFKNSNWGIDNPISFFGKFNVPAIFWITVLVALCIFVAVANLWRIVETFRASKWSIGGFIAHLGIATLLAGLIISQGYEFKEQLLVQSGDVTKSRDFNITYEGMTHAEEGGVFDHENKVKFTVADHEGHTDFTAYPGFYYNVGDDQQLKPFVWPYQQHAATQDVYLTLYGPQLDVWDTPIPFKPGETKDPDKKGIIVTYDKLNMGGAAGVGRTFSADVTVTIRNPDRNLRTYHVQPSLKITKEGLDPAFADIGNTGLTIRLDHIDAADQSAFLQVHFKEPIWPIDLFYKPMVILVWIGAGIMTLGGLIAAFYRRPPRVKPIQPIIDRTEQELNE